MQIVVKGLILIIFLVVIFGQNIFPTRTLYWSAYFVMFSLVPFLWIFMFWVSKKGALQVLKTLKTKDTEGITKENMDSSLFVGMVSENSQDDLIRGRLCFYRENIYLIGKRGRKREIVWTADKGGIASIGFGTVAGVRKGFTFHFKNAEKSFTCIKVYKHREILYKALEWKI